MIDPKEKRKKAKAMESIVKAREDAMMSRRDVEEQLKIPFRTLQAWELGFRQCPEWAELLVVDKLKQIAKQKGMMYFLMASKPGEEPGILFASEDRYDVAETANRIWSETGGIAQYSAFYIGYGQVAKKPSGWTLCGSEHYMEKNYIPE